MNAAHIPLQPEQLLEHEPFVRSLARSLLGRGGESDDLVQDTWLAALTHPPQSAGSARAFLGQIARNLARNERRGAGARRHREQIAARPESVESVAAIHARLSVQREVVDAVLSLEEPYRGAVMLHFYEGASAAEIAKRRGVPAGTVRSQLSRALEILRAKLDAKFGGDRGAWATALIPWLERVSSVAPTSAVSSTVVLIGAALLIASITPIAWLIARDRTSIEARDELAGPSPRPLAAPAIAGAPPNVAGTRVVSESRQVAAPSQSVATPPSTPDFDSKSIDELLMLVVQAQRVLEAKLYTPDPGIVESEKKLLALPGTGVARILTSTKYAGLVTPESADSFYSCAIRNHGDEEQPDLRFLNERLVASEVHGNRLSFGVDLGSIDLMSVRDTPAVRPEGMDEHAQAAWALCWSRPVWFDRRGDEPLEESWEVISRIGEMFNRDYQSAWEGARKLNLFLGVRPQVGGTFLVRQIAYGNGQHLEGSRDLLAVVTTLQLDEDGCTIAWRILRSWHIDWPLYKKGRSFQPRSNASVPAAPDSLYALGVAELIELIRDIRANAVLRLTGIPEDLPRRYATTLSSSDTRLVRLLSAGMLGPLVQSTTAPGSVSSFLTLERNENRLPDVAFEAGVYRPAGDYILDLGSLPLAQVRFSAGSAPDALSPDSREVWQWMWTHDQSSSTPRGSSRSQSQRRSERSERKRLGAEVPVSATVGHTYLFRSQFGPHDVLVAFTTVDRDPYGDTLLWRLLKTWPQGDTLVSEMMNRWPRSVLKTR